MEEYSWNLHPAITEFRVILFKLTKRYYKNDELLAIHHGGWQDFLYWLHMEGYADFTDQLTKELDQFFGNIPISQDWTQ